MPSNLTSLAIAGMPVFPGGSLVPPTTGTFFYVNNATTGNSDTNLGTDAGSPLATIKQAISQCTASKGDVVIVGPGHAESISGAAAIANNKIGVSVIGLGNGTLKPKVTLHTAATTITVTAANVTWRNINIATDVDAVVTVFSVTAAGFTCDGVNFVETAACACLQFILTTAAATDMTVINCRWIQTATAATALQQWIVLTGADRFTCLNNFCNLKGFATSNPANGVLVGVTTASVDVQIISNNFISSNSTGAVPISLLAASTGFVANNNVASAKTAIAGSIALASAFGSQNFACHVANKNGLLEPVVDA